MLKIFVEKAKELNVYEFEIKSLGLRTTFCELNIKAGYLKSALDEFERLTANREKCDFNVSDVQNNLYQIIESIYYLEAPVLTKQIFLRRILSSSAIKLFNLDCLKYISTIFEQEEYQHFLETYRAKTQNGELIPYRIENGEIIFADDFSVDNDKKHVL